MISHGKTRSWTAGPDVELYFQFKSQKVKTHWAHVVSRTLMLTTIRAAASSPHGFCRKIVFWLFAVSFQAPIHATFLFLHYLIITEPIIGFYLQQWSAVALKTISVTL